MECVYEDLEMVQGEPKNGKQEGKEVVVKTYLEKNGKE